MQKFFDPQNEINTNNVYKHTNLHSTVYGDTKTINRLSTYHWLCL